MRVFCPEGRSRIFVVFTLPPLNVVVIGDAWLRLLSVGFVLGFVKEVTFSPTQKCFGLILNIQPNLNSVSFG